jgi:hypothetical protein
MIARHHRFDLWPPFGLHVWRSGNANARTTAGSGIYFWGARRVSALSLPAPQPVAFRHRQHHLAARTHDSEREKAIASGCDEFDAKPIDFESLVATIRRVVVNPK